MDFDCLCFSLFENSSLWCIIPVGSFKKLLCYYCCCCVCSVFFYLKPALIVLINIEPVCEKTNDLGSDQVQYKPG